MDAGILAIGINELVAKHRWRFYLLIIVEQHILPRTREIA